MSTENIVSKVRKLMRLAESPNANEAALAAAKAQELITAHNLNAEMLALDDASKAEPDEPIEDFAKKGAPLDTRKWYDRWRPTLGVVVARANGCFLYRSGDQLAIVGRPSDVDAVRYLYSYLTNEIERLTEKEGRGCGASWKLNFAVGCVDAVSAKFKAAKLKVEDDLRRTATGQTGLMRVEYDVISDYTMSLDTVLEPVMAYAESQS